MLEQRRLRDSAGAKLASIRESAQEKLASLQENAKTGWESGRQGISNLGRNVAEKAAQAPRRWHALRDGLRFWSAKGIYSRAPLNSYWRATFAKLRSGRVLAINPVKFVWNLLRDVKLGAIFTAQLFRARTK
ncbi:MAG: hypothetical protein BWZ10_02988 [candidate division BRC1 bacterium ADurb.BinA364]|nr:MAG: hypothetical protein BWZ10_02988 [candidate division BRC1 bacterium ADurb.BinA364]